MKFLGVQFVPLNQPLKKHLETFAVASTFAALTFSAIVCVWFIGYILLYTKYWLFATIYLIWIWIIDRNTPNQGGRPNAWMRSLPSFRYAANYFPVTVKSVENAKLDPTKNYIMCSFPHGILGLGTGLSIVTDKFKNIYRNHVLHAITLKTNFYIPIYRDFILSIGACSASADSLNWILNYTGGGRIVTLIVGGAAESLYGTGGQYCLVLKNRKGFIKLALKNGSGLIPTLSFGETDTFKQVQFSKGSSMHRFQEYIKSITGLMPILFYGRGFLQYSFGFIPLQKPINIICGKPIEVKKIANPTQSDIDQLHARFVQELIKLFEQHKSDYVENPEQCELTIV